MNRTKLSCCALFVALGAALPSWSASALGQQPENPLRKVPPRAQVTRGTADVQPERIAPEKAESASPKAAAVTTPSPAIAAAIQPAAKATPAPVREVRSQDTVFRPAAHRGVVQPLGVSSNTTFELGGGEYIVEDPGTLMPGEVMMDEFMAGDCCGGSGCAQCCLIPCPVLSLDNFEFSSGVHGFTGPKNRGSSGSFGFHSGFNWGAPVPCAGGSMGMQFGMNAVLSNYSGAAFTDDSRTQIFLTGGLFRRVDWGLQGGLVVDYLSDDWYTDTDLTQVRGEASWMFPCTHELGFWFAAAAGDDTQISTLTGTNGSFSETWEPTNLYAFFYRHRFAMMEGAQARFYAGFSGDSDGLIGGDLRLPLSYDWALESGFAYLIPDEATTGLPGGGHEDESWNISVSLVWYPGCRSAIGNDYYRPLFQAADNGSFMVSRQP